MTRRALIAAALLCVWVALMWIFVIEVPARRNAMPRGNVQDMERLR